MQSRLFFVLCAAVLMISAVQAQDSLNVRQVGLYRTPWGNCTNTQMVGNFLYCAMYPGLVVLDASDVNDLQYVKYLDLGNTTGQLRVLNDYAYLAVEDDSLYIVDISDPIHAVRVGSFELACSVDGIAAAGNYVYILTNDILWIIDVSTPNAPYAAAAFAIEPANDIIIAGYYAYIISEEELHIINISNPLQPYGVGSCQGGGNWIKKQGNYTYIKAWIWGLSIVDVSNPTAPIVIGSYNTFDYTNLDFAVQGDYAYLLDDRNGITTLDISNPAVPTFMSQCEYHDSLLSICLSGNYAFTTDDRGAKVVDFTNPFMPVIVSVYSPIIDIRCVARIGNYAYLGSGYYLWLMNISNPAEPDMSGYYTTVHCDDIAISGDFAYAIHAYLGLSVLDVSNPAFPVTIGRWRNTQLHLMDVAIAGNYAYISGNNKFYTIDVSNPAEPIDADSCLLSPRSDRSDIAIIGNYAYAVRGGTMDIIDISNRAEPVYVSTFQVSGHSIAAIGNTAYILSYYRLSVVDLTNPTAPVVIDAINAPDGKMVAAEDNYVYVTYATSLRVFDAANPHVLTEVGFYDLPFGGLSIAAADQYAYVAGWYSLGIYECSVTTSASDIRASHPLNFRLQPCYPNPFNPVTTVSYNLPAASRVQLNVYDLLGRRVAVLTEGMQTAGVHQASFNGSNLASGTYLVQLNAGENTAVQKAVLVK